MSALKISIYPTEVIDVRPLTKRMFRITLGGEGLRGFAGGQTADERFKLLLPIPGEPRPRLPESTGGVINPMQSVGPMRTFTVRRFDPELPALDFDLTMHTGGLASDWALNARIGDHALVAGPLSVYHLDPRASHYVLAGDLAALPAIATLVERLPAHASARVLLEVEDGDDELELSSAAALTVTWLHRDGAPRGEDSLLAATIRGLPLSDDGVTAIWAAGEASTMRAIRRHLRDTLRLPRGVFQICGYWREHLTEDEAMAADRRAVDAAVAAGKSEAEIEDAGVY